MDRRDCARHPSNAQEPPIVRTGTSIRPGSWL
jgi:hypothetical protein